jgi:hypothetical protein
MPVGQNGAGQIKGKLKRLKDYRSDALIGGGEIFLRDGRRQYSLVVAIGQILQIEG